jgi:hypothetical protein
MTVLVTVLTVVVALLAVLVAGLLRSHAEILRVLHERGVDLHPDSHRARAPASLGVSVPRPRTDPRPAVDVAGTSPDGDAAVISVAGADHSTLLAFLTSGCTTCIDFWNAFADADQLRIPGDARLVVVTKGEEGESSARLRTFAPLAVPVVMSSAAWADYDVPVAPYFVFINGPSSRIIGEGAAATWDHLVGMMARAVEDTRRSSRPRRGRNRRLDGAVREARVDSPLAGADIDPGHPSLYPVADVDLYDRRD